MALEMKDACETCQVPLAGDGEAFICSYECTFCQRCADTTHKGVCPNCEGELVVRPRRIAKN